MFPTGSFSDASITSRSRSAPDTSSRVALNAATSSGGSLRIKPTVSDSRKLPPFLKLIFLITVSRVEKSWFAANIPQSFESDFKSVDLPLFVYPTSAAVKAPSFLRLSRLSFLLLWTSSRRKVILFIRLSSFLLCLSNSVSPGPLVPMPPPVLDIW
ncbi:hypothetical protein SDC9_192300 [bioreactor metagenome]|uniref:Uncharacterized protein n=1 Tax=bioreactor metagenome TaxID=1076179 RepID=A0A645I0D8_9ZZZZ